VFIDVWFDVVCPFCYIGRRRLIAVLERTRRVQDVEIRHHAYQLSPEAPRQTDDDLNTLLAQRYNMTRVQAVETNRRVGEQAQAYGLQFAFDRARWANTRDAHRLIKLAAERGMEDTLLEALYSGFFVAGRRIGDPEDLMRLAMDAGIERSAVRDMLNSERFNDEIAMDRSNGIAAGLRGVPFYVIGEQRGGSELITMDNLTRLLREAHPA
jgi:predicted DsbA family dithiol-disulfide isomerase